MADVILENPAQQDVVVPEGKAALDALMNRNLGIGVPGQMQPPVQQQVQQEPSAQEPVVVNQPEPTATPEFKFDVFKEKFGYEKPDDILTEIEQLRAFKAAPPKEELKFENDASKKLYEAIIAGKSSEVGEILAQQNRLEKLSTMEVTAQTAAEIVKAGIQLKYPTLTPDLIEHKFNRQYPTPKQPVQYTDEEPDEYQVRVDEWKAKVKEVEMDLMMDATVTKSDILNAKAKLVLPEIAPQVDQDYLQWKQDQAEAEKLNAEVFEAYKAFKSEDVKYGVDFIDEANKINAKIEYVPSPEAFKKAQEMATDIDKFWGTFRNSDGSPNRQKFISFLARYSDESAFIASVVNQAKNATIKASLPDNLSNDATRRQVVNVGEPSELDKAMEAAGIKRG